MISLETMYYMDCPEYYVQEGGAGDTTMVDITIRRSGFLGEAATLSKSNISFFMSGSTREGQGEAFPLPPPKKN